MNMKCNEFFKKHSFGAVFLDARGLLEDFASEMAAGLAGGPSSLAMIPSYITIGHPIPVGRPVIVLDAGGTNLRVCVVTFDAHGRPSISHFSKYPMPGSDVSVTADEFFDTLARYVEPVLRFAEDIGFCFSYAAEITPECDGRLIRWTKQIKAKEVEGMMVGAELAKRLAPKGFRGKITVLNDTVATLLGGVSASVSRRYDGYVGFILGTGTNTATIVPNGEIGKCPDLGDGAMIVNMESGSFGKVPQTEIDRRLDGLTMDPGSYKFEKMISGGYLGALGLAALQTAAEDGFFSKDAASAILAMKALNNKDLDDFCDNPFLVSGPFAALPLADDDRRVIQAIGGATYARAAYLSAVNLAAAIIRSGGGRDPLAPVCVNIDGSTYYRTRSVEFRSRIEATIRALLAPEGLYYRLVAIPDSPVIGAAVAGLTRDA